MKLNTDIFREYGIRGEYPKDVNKDVFFEVGQSVVSSLKKDKPKIVVCRDARIGSGPLAKAFIDGAVEMGARVVDIGTGPASMLYFALGFLKVDIGVMITASHYSKKENGLKIVKKGMVFMSGDEIKEILSQKYKKNLNEKGIVQEKDVSDDYLDAITKNFHINRKIRVLINECDGVLKLLLPKLIKRLGLLEGGKKPDLCISFDCDGDGLFVYDKKGECIRPDFVGGVIAEGLIKKKENVIYGLGCSHSVLKYFRNKGIVFISNKVGSSNMRKGMLERKAVFGMELNGHYYFKEMKYSESSFFALRKVIEQMDKNPEKSMDDLVKEKFVGFYHTGIINLKRPKDKSFEEILEKLRLQYRGGAISTMDGLLVEFNGWWFNLRQSCTEDLLRLVVEAGNEDLLEEKKKEILEIIES